MNVTHNATKKKNFSENVLNLFEKLFKTHSGWKNAIDSIKFTLFKLSLVYIRSENLEGTSQDARDQVAFHLYALGTLMDDLLPYYDADESDRADLLDSALTTSAICGNEDEIIASMHELSIAYIRDAEFTQEVMEKREEISFHLEVLHSIILDMKNLAQE